jgi:hypothetical protein
MNKEKQRIAIAKACGWSCFEPATIQYTAKRSDGKWDLIPDYPNDLNAMHEAEKVLNLDKQFFYARRLPKRKGLDSSLTAGFETIHATAAQRAEAFLKVLNLWEDPQAP